MGSEQYQQDFLWFTYFGITKKEAEDNRDVAMRKCIDRAYRDLSRTLEYKKSTAWLDGKEGKVWKLRAEYIRLKEDFKSNVATKLSGEINDLPVTSADDFDVWHRQICDAIRKLAAANVCGIDLFKNGMESFTFGQAQKWVNMTLKNMLVMGLWPEMEKIKKYMHIPLDSYIMQAAKGLGVNSQKYGLSEWSRIQNYCKYLEYQQEIRKKVKCPIDWEGPAWIAQVKGKENDE